MPTDSVIKFWLLILAMLCKQWKLFWQACNEITVDLWEQ